MAQNKDRDQEYPKSPKDVVLKKGLVIGFGDPPTVPPPPAKRVRDETPPASPPTPSS